MSAKKNQRFLLSEEETQEFLKFLKKNKIKLKDAADIICMSYAALREAIKGKRVVACWRDTLKLIIENKELKNKINSIEQTLK